MKNPKKTSPIAEGFWFLNHSVIGQLHPSRPFIKESGYCAPKPVYTCPKCGKYTHLSNGCYDCQEKENDELLEFHRTMQKESFFVQANEYRDTLLRCAARGTCDVLKVHHEYLSNDPERLTTEFLVGLICGKDYKGNKDEDVILSQMLPGGMHRRKK
jgi:hypothetical protein